MIVGTSSEIATDGDKELISLVAEVDIKGNTELSLSANAVFSNNDLLFDILLRLPILSLVLFKSVSKQWLSLITSSRFVTSRSKIPNLDPPSALLVRRWTNVIEEFEYDFGSFDIRIPFKKLTFSTKKKFDFESFDIRILSKKHWSHKILQSCNGLLLCFLHYGKYTYYGELCVYNPTIKMLKMVPDNCSGTNLRMAFDPTKSPHYKLIQQVFTPVPDYSVQLHTYSSETGIWSVCGDRFRESSFNGFREGVYWNDAIHWLNPASVWTNLHIKLDIANEQPVLTVLELPVTIDGKSYDQLKLFESRGCLLLLGKDYVQPRQLNVYEMRNDDSEWLVKYIVNLDDIMMPFPDNWMISKCVWCIVLGEREEDSFMIIDGVLSTMVVQYNLVSKTVQTLCDLKPNSFPGGLSNFNGFQFIPSFAGV